MFDRPAVAIPGGGLPLGAEVADTLASLAQAPSGPLEMSVLAGTDLSRVPLDQRVDAIRAWERAASWVAAQSLAAIGSLQLPDVGPDPTPPALQLPDWTREELGCALAVSFGEAARRLGLAADLRRRLPRAAAALRTGALSLAKAEAISRGALYLDDTQTGQLEQLVLPAAERQTLGELRRAVSRAVLLLDPDGAAERARAAQRDRGVTLFPQTDGMADVWATLPAADAQTVMNGLDAEADRIAARQRENGDEVPGQSARRADALLLWAQQALARPEQAGGTVQGRRPSVHVTVPLTMLLGLTDEPGELDGYGPIDADTARRLAADGTWCRLVTDPVRGDLLDYGRTTYTPPADLREFVLARYGVCNFPGCHRPGRRCHLDHLTEWQHGGTTCKASP